MSNDITSFSKIIFSYFCAETVRLCCFGQLTSLFNWWMVEVYWLLFPQAAIVFDNWNLRSYTSGNLIYVFLCVILWNKLRRIYIKECRMFLQAVNFSFIGSKRVFTPQLTFDQIWCGLKSLILNLIANLISTLFETWFKTL